MSYRQAVWLIGVLLMAGCVFRRAEETTPKLIGVLNAATPLETPIGNQSACAINLYWSGQNRSTSDSLYGYYTPTQYSDDATLEVDGQLYSIVGVGGKAGEKIDGEKWRWQWQLADDGQLVDVTPPETLYGWEDELDTLLNQIATRGQPVAPSARTLTVVERYITCGTVIGIRGEIVGDTLHVSP